LISFSQQLGIAKRADFVSMVPYDQVARYLGAADLFAFTSQTETQGLVTLEALAAGLPVVAYDAMGTRDTIEHEVNGVLTETEIGELASAILNLISNPVKMAEMKQAALRTAKTMDIGELAKKLADVYAEAIKARKQHSC
jgi:glycosyltransferase involved in cell wall biosynthesis